MDKELIYSWTDFWQCCDVVAQSIIDGRKSYTMAIAIVRGGYYLGDYLSRRLKLPLGVIVTQSYSDSTNQQQPLFIGELSSPKKPQGNILVIDDLVDSGVTLNAVQEKLIQEYNVQVDTAVIWQKLHSQFTPDYYHSITPSDCWIVQPFEQS